MSRFKNLDRVRVKFGIDRGHYGTIIHVGGDDGTYYGVKLDCHDNAVGYSEHELDAAVVHPLWHGSGCFIPLEVAVCPECGGELMARSMQWDAETGQPEACAIDVICCADPDLNHRWWQSTWQPVRDKIAKWCGASS